MADLSGFPDDHRRLGRYEARLPDGTRVSLDISEHRRPLRGHELVKASMSMQMGRRAAFDVKEPSLALVIGNHPRKDIEALPNGSYRHGRWVERSLRTLSERLTDHYKPQNSPDEDEPSPPGFSR